MLPIGRTQNISPGVHAYNSEEYFLLKITIVTCTFNGWHFMVFYHYISYFFFSFIHFFLTELYKYNIYPEAMDSNPVEALKKFFELKFAIA